MYLKKITYLLLIVFLSSYSFALECFYDARVEKVEFSLDDPTFSNNFDGTSGIIYTLTYNITTGKHNVWKTNLLSIRTDKGNVIKPHNSYNYGIDFDAISDANNNQMLIINTSKYNTIYKKLYLKNLGSCKATYMHSHMADKMLEVGGSTQNTGPWSFFHRDYYTLNPNQIKSVISSQNIANYYSGIFRVGSSAFYQAINIKQWFTTDFWFDGQTGFGYPVAENMDSFLQTNININDNFTFSADINNSCSTPKNITYKLHIYDYISGTNVHSKSNGYIQSETTTINGNTNKHIELNYTVLGESDYRLSNYYFACFDLNYYDAIFNRIFMVVHYCGYIGSLNHSYLNPTVPKGITFGTTNDGIPYIGGNIEFLEYNRHHPQDIPANDFEREIIIKKEKNGIWSDIFIDNKLINTIIPANGKYVEDYKYEIYDFNNWENSSADIYISSKWLVNNQYQYRFPTFTLARKDPPINIDFSHLLMSTDLPLDIYPNGGSSTAYLRDILFNLKDYKQRNVSIKTKIINPDSGLESLDFTIISPTNFDIPAQSSYPVPIKIKYNGPIENKRYIVENNFSYFDKINNINKSKIIYGDIYIKNDLISTNYYDLIPTEIKYNNLYLNEESTIDVHVENNGNINYTSPYKIKFYYKNITESIFHFIEEKTMPANQNNISFNFTPTKTGLHIIKVVIDTTDNVEENSTQIPLGEKNNALASISLVRDIDLVVDYAYPLYNNITKEGVIPFEIKVHNKGIGGIDDITVDLNISYKNNFWYFKTSSINIPQEGRIFTYNWNVTSVTPRVHTFKATATSEYDKELSNNYKIGNMDFCPLPWYSSPLDCFNECDFNCLNKLTNRYDAKCNGINGCQFYNQTFANSCNGYLKDSFAYFNSTYNAKCPNADLKELKKVTKEKIDIKSNCKNIIVNKKPIYFRGENIQMNIIQCVR